MSLNIKEQINVVFKCDNLISTLINTLLSQEFNHDVEEPIQVRFTFDGGEVIRKTTFRPFTSNSIKGFAVMVRMLMNRVDGDFHSIINIFEKHFGSFVIIDYESVIIKPNYGNDNSITIRRSSSHLVNIDVVISGSAFSFGKFIQSVYDLSNIDGGINIVFEISHLKYATYKYFMEYAVDKNENKNHGVTIEFSDNYTNGIFGKNSMCSLVDIFSRFADANRER